MDGQQQKRTQRETKLYRIIFSYHINKWKKKKSKIRINWKLTLLIDRNWKIDRRWERDRERETHTKNDIETDAYERHTRKEEIERIDNRHRHTQWIDWNQFTNPLKRRIISSTA